MIGILLPLLLSLPAAEDKPAPKLPIGKETTYVTGPLDKEGYIDYEAALNRRLGKGVSPEKNANVLLWKAFGPRPEGGEGMPPAFFKLLGIEEPPTKGDYFIPLGRYATHHLKLEPAESETLYDQQSRAIQRPWSAKDYPHIAGWLKANDKPLALVIEASKRPQYFNPLVSRRNEKEPRNLLGVLMPGVQACRECANALAARALLRAGEGKLDEAWQDLLACHRLGRLVARGGTIIEGLVGMAIDRAATDADLAYLGHEGLTARRVRGCLQDLRALPTLPSMADKIDLAERFTYLDCVQLVRRRGPDALEFDAVHGGALPKKLTPRAEEALAAIDWEPALRNGNRFYDRMAAAMRIKDRSGRGKAFDAIEEDLTETRLRVSKGLNLLKILLGRIDPGKEVGERISDVVVGLLMPAFRKVQHAADRAEQVGRNRDLAFALAAYRLDKGRYPAKLADLAPKYLAKIPGDLFSDEPLVYCRDGKGYLLYSVGINGKDEGGHWSDDEPPSDDLSVRMPLPVLKPRK
jgi:hypothetical protein